MTISTCLFLSEEMSIMIDKQIKFDIVMIKA